MKMSTQLLQLNGVYNSNPPLTPLLLALLYESIVEAVLIVVIAAGSAGTNQYTLKQFGDTILCGEWRKFSSNRVTVADTFSNEVILNEK
jgi:hypothetical protein